MFLWRNKKDSASIFNLDEKSALSVAMQKDVLTNGKCANSDHHVIGLYKEEYLIIILRQFFLFLHKEHMLWVHIRSI